MNVLPRLVWSPAPACGRQGLRPGQSDLSQMSSALNNIHLDWGTCDRDRGTSISNAERKIKKTGNGSNYVDKNSMTESLEHYIS